VLRGKNTRLFGGSNEGEARNCLGGFFPVEKNALAIRNRDPGCYAFKDVGGETRERPKKRYATRCQEEGSAGKKKNGQMERGEQGKGTDALKEKSVVLA